MTGEDYVNKELMPLLLEKGCFLDKVFVQDFRPIWYTKESNAPTWQDCDAYYIPTQSQVLKWLRVAHNLHITIKPYITNEGFMYAYEIFKLEQYKYMVSLVKAKAGFENNENVCEDAINYCLTNLI